MPKVKRYIIGTTQYGTVRDFESANGKYVKYDDFEKCLQKILLTLKFKYEVERIEDLIKEMIE